MKVDLFANDFPKGENEVSITIESDGILAGWINIPVSVIVKTPDPLPVFIPLLSYK
jgi:hypothetical protein